MIKYFPALFLLFAFSFYSCNNDVGPVNQEFADLFQIHLQNGFSNTPVKVRVDYSQVFFDTVSTGYVLSVAAIIPVKIRKGTHFLSVTAGSTTSNTTFTIADTLYIGVNYSSTNSRITYRFQQYPFGYR